jgi:recombinational DNA repair protein (RecF pathway)
MYKCKHCGRRGVDVAWSTRLSCFVCDPCYERLISVVEGEARDK